MKRRTLLLLAGLLVVLAGGAALGWQQGWFTGRQGEGSGPRQKVTLETSPGTVMTLLYVAPQSFQMGSPDKEVYRGNHEKRHLVKITKGYWLAQTEVTQKQWRDVMGAEPWKGKPYTTQGNDVAASYVDWDQAVAFCNKLNELEKDRLPAGYRYQLPSEAEWELACRAGTETAWSCGNDPAQLGQYAVFGQALEGGPCAVRTRKANAWGFYDMHGNVSEWCADKVDYQSGVVSSTYVEGVADPLNADGPQRATRGGIWYHPAHCVRSAFRYVGSPGGATYDLGFRPVLAARAQDK